MVFKPKQEGQITTKPSKDVKRVMWNPGRGTLADPTTFFDYHGMKFFVRTVQPVTDQVYEAVRHIHGFMTVEGVRNVIYDYGNVEGYVPRFTSGDNIELGML